MTRNLAYAIAVATLTTASGPAAAETNPSQWATEGPHCRHERTTNRHDSLRCEEIILHCDGRGELSAVDRNGQPVQVIGRDGRPRPNPWAGIAELLEITEMSMLATAEQDWRTATGWARSRTRMADAKPIGRFSRGCMAKRKAPIPPVWRNDPDDRFVTHPGGPHAQRPCTAITSTAWGTPRRAAHAAARAFAYTEGRAARAKLQRANHTMHNLVSAALHTLDRQCQALDGAARPQQACAAFAARQAGTQRTKLGAATWEWLARACTDPDQLAPGWRMLLDWSGVPHDDLPRPHGPEPE